MKKLIYALCFSGFCAGIGCQSDMPKNDAAMSEKSNMDMAFTKLFDTVNVVKMHLFSGEESENYPYDGKAIEGEELTMLADDLKPADAAVFACYWLENDNSYLLRVKNSDASNSLVLARYNTTTGKLEKTNDLATYSCTEAQCKQVDSWLIDLDDDRDLELVTLEMSMDADGKKVGESFTVFTKDDKGMFSKADDQLAALAPQDRYVPSSHR